MSRIAIAAMALALVGSPAAGHPAFADDADAEPPRAHGETGLDGFRATGDERPESLVPPVRFDPGALPVATWGEPHAASGFHLTSWANGYRLYLRSRLYAEVVVHDSTGGPEFTAFTGGSFFEGMPPECGPGHVGSFPARWAGLSPRHWTDDGVDVEMGDGDFDVATCDAKPRVSIHARAAAVVPGYVYGLLVAHGEDDGTLFVFLPRGVLVSAAGDPAAPITLANTGPFTRLTMPLERGAARSAVLRITPASMRLWSRLRSGAIPAAHVDDPMEPHDALLVNVDVAWQDDRKLGSISVALPRGHDRRAYAGLVAAAASITN